MYFRKKTFMRFSSGSGGGLGPCPPAPIFHLSHMENMYQNKTFGPPGPRHRVMTKNFPPWPPISILDPLLRFACVNINIRWTFYAPIVYYNSGFQKKKKKKKKSMGNIECLNSSL